MAEPTWAGLPPTAVVPTQVTVVNTDIDNGTLEHTRNPRAHACVPAPLPTPATLIEDDQECRVLNPTVPSVMAGETVTNHLIDNK